MKKIGKYEIKGLLGKGGMGKVYKVALPVVGRIVALKLLDPNPFLVSLIGEEKITELFVTEAVTIAGLRHPNIVEILDYDAGGEKPYYTMDFYSNNLGDIIGETYRTEAPSRIIDISRAVSYARQTLEGLDCLHHNGIIHRDIKPFNLLLTDRDTVKICDFGLSKLRKEAFRGPESLKVGSPWYAAPEQEEDPDNVDFSADTYSVGVMLFRMLCGVLPGETAKKPSEINSDLDGTWDRFLEKAVARNPKERFSTAREMIYALTIHGQRWENKKENICRLPMPSSGKAQIEGTGVLAARKEPVKVGSRDARAFFKTNRLWQPKTHVKNDFETDLEKGIVRDRATNLAWEWSGSPFPCDYERVLTHIGKLNHEAFGGYNRWRMPTVEELLTLLTDTPHGRQHCLPVVFDKKQRWIWTADRKSFTAAWYVNMDVGYVHWQYFPAYYYVKGVCDL